MRSPSAIPMLAVIVRGTPSIPFETERLVQHGLEALGDELGAGRQRHAFGEHDELVTAEAADGVAVAQHAGETGGHCPQELVARLVPQGVVDVLEVVEVHEQGGHRSVLTPSACQHLLGSVEDECTVRQSGERVVEGLMPDLVEQPGIAEGDAHLAGEAVEPLEEVEVVVQPFGCCLPRPPGTR